MLVLHAALWGFDGLHLSHQVIKNAETLLVEYDKMDSIKPLAIRIGDKRFPFFNLPFKRKYSYALVPIAYNTILGTQTLFFEHLDGERLKNSKVSTIKIVWGGYKKERLRVDPAKVKLSQEDKKRAEKEYFEAKKIYKEISPNYRAVHGVQEPLISMVTSGFGNERLFNGVRKSYHSGIDYRAQTGTAVKAFGWGRVAMVSDRFYGGLMIALDHGHGIYSVYAHLSQSKVKVGDHVKVGDIIALSGATGRITGPHLHFSTKVHGITVSPVQLMQLLKRISKKSGN